MKWVFRVGLAVALLGVLGAVSGGCGSGSDETTSQPLSRQAFVKQANRICRQGEEDRTNAVSAALQKLEGAGGAVPTGKSQTLEKLATEVALPQLQHMIDQLAALEPPPADRAKVETIVKRFEEGVEEGEAQPRAYFAGTVWTKADKAAATYDLTDCSF